MKCGVNVRGGKNADRCSINLMNPKCFNRCITLNSIPKGTRVGVVTLSRIYHRFYRRLFTFIPFGEFSFSPYKSIFKQHCINYGIDEKGAKPLNLSRLKIFLREWFIVNNPIKNYSKCKRRYIS